MKLLHTPSALLSAGILLLNLLGYWGTEAHGQQVRIEVGSAVSYQTEDGWTIHGTLVLPEGDTRVRAPGVVLVSEPGMRIRTIYNANLVRTLIRNGMVVLTIDVRGTSSSHGKKDFEKFTMKEIDALQLDIKGAVKFLSSKNTVDGRRIAIVAPSLTANYAVLEASENSAVQALVLISGTKLSQRARDYIKYRKDIPILSILGKSGEKSKQAIASEAYFLSENRNSGLLFGVGHGLLMFYRPGALDESVAQWLGNNLKGLGTETNVSFKSEDGWTLRGTLYMPDGLEDNSKVAGVVFVHGFMHDQQHWYSLAREVVKEGMAALVFDWRGTRKSINEGKGEVGVDLYPEESDNIYLDVKAAINSLASQKQVDASRIGLIAATATCNHAVRASIGDPRIKTMVGLSFYAPAPDVRQYLPTSDIPLLLVASTEDFNPDGVSLAEGTREVYRLSKNKDSQFLLFDDAGRGASMMHIEPALRPMIVRWLGEKLAR